MFPFLLFLNVVITRALFHFKTIVVATVLYNACEELLFRSQSYTVHFSSEFFEDLDFCRLYSSQVIGLLGQGLCLPLR